MGEPDGKPRVMRQARKVLAEVHHGLREGKATGDADALAHVYERAKECDVPADDLATIRTGFKTIAQSLVEEGSRRRRPRWRSRRDLGAGQPGLPPGPRPPELPPGRRG